MYSNRPDFEEPLPEVFGSYESTVCANNVVGTLVSRFNRLAFTQSFISMPTRILFEQKSVGSWWIDPTAPYGSWFIVPGTPLQVTGHWLPPKVLPRAICNLFKLEILIPLFFLGPRWDDRSWPNLSATTVKFSVNQQVCHGVVLHLW